MIYTLFVSLIVLAAIFMILVVLIQESKGGGLASNFSSSNAIMGVRKTTDVVEKATWFLAIAMVVLSVACAYVAPQATTDQSVMENSATKNQTTNPIHEHTYLRVRRCFRASHAQLWRGQGGRCGRSQDS